MLRDLEEVRGLLAWPFPYGNLDRAYDIVVKLVDQLRAEDAQHEQETIRTFGTRG